MPPQEQIIPSERIERSILLLRGQKVILDADLAKIYGVETRVLNQAVKRNRDRFPEDFTFRLTRDEASGVAASRSQSVILKRGGNIKYLPYVFTEHGAIMAANVLNSQRAVRMSAYVASGHPTSSYCRAADGYCGQVGRVGTRGHRARFQHQDPIRRGPPAHDATGAQKAEDRVSG